MNFMAVLITSRFRQCFISDFEDQQFTYKSQLISIKINEHNNLIYNCNIKYLYLYSYIDDDNDDDDDNGC